jgi:hypothetical protein
MRTSFPVGENRPVRMGFAVANLVFYFLISFMLQLASVIFIIPLWQSGTLAHRQPRLASVVPFPIPQSAIRNPHLPLALRYRSYVSAPLLRCSNSLSSSVSLLWLPHFSSLPLESIQPARWTARHNNSKLISKTRVSSQSQKEHAPVSCYRQAMPSFRPVRGPALRLLRGPVRVLAADM